MDALDRLQKHAEIATVRLAPYVITFDQQSRNYRIVKFCRTGESHMGSFKDREDAEDWLLTRLPKPAATRVEP